ncbi:PD-(D/E)XK motif protein [Rhodovulum sulfidophilum]|uniref:PD-(D/E)XK motif protein n=1 Tax=Rhodovulum sulfidophilum TaxID=35806 RepID=UPI001927CA7E|nr:PD-(D/E)XK motif protein [Rhodovulum sulfidophilum]MBL3586511.1 PD-(D/E)XK motif protein [Rhodovulum sulfidophilum]MCE8438362.1 PD-(D/E)XK motif protein [Rhodovulum sulfidophilum]MCE8469993.1 PD-(D/E)XK motif protein [Rhodovulum sulfidophilum]
MPEAIRLSREWDLIRKSGKGDGVLEVPSRATQISTGFGLVRVATGPAGEPRLLIPVARPARNRMPTGNRNLSVGHASYRSSGKGLHFIDLMLTEPRLAGVFADLSEKILERIETGEGPENAVRGTIEDFRKLLAASAATEVPLNELAGLVGELMMLERLCTGNPDAVRAWTGPLGQRHDFRSGDVALETKTSTRADATRVQIHGADQLLAPAGADLYLAHLRIEQTDGGTLSVAGLRRRIIELGADEVLLDTRLAAIGCRDPQGDAWNDTAFASEGIDIYCVRDGFPRIVSSSFSGGSLPDGIVGLEYALDLSHARDHLLDEVAMGELIRSFAA